MNKYEEQLREITFATIKDETNFNVLELRLSRVPPKLCTPSVLKKTVSFFQDMTTPEGRIVVLPSGDVFIFYPNRFTREEVSPVLVRVWFLFTKNPEEMANSSVAVFYSLPDDKVSLLEEIKQAAARTKTVEKERVERPAVLPNKNLKELTPEGLEKAISLLSGADFSNMIRHQSVCALLGDAAPQELYEEVFVAISDLADAVLPNISLTATPWLFQYLTETLDKRVLATASRHEDGAFMRDFSLNLNVSTILSEAFEAFNYNVISSMRSSIVLELQPVDILSDLPSYLKARDYVQKQGFKVCIDGVTTETLPFMDRERLGADFLKLVYTPSLPDMLESDSVLRESFDKVGTNSLILCRVDDEKAVKNFKEKGVTLFQGRHIQQLLSDARRRGR